MSFKVGQKVICISEKMSELLTGLPLPPDSMPKKNEIVEIIGFDPSDRNFIIIKPYTYNSRDGKKQSFRNTIFRPLYNIPSKLKKELNEKFPITEERPDHQPTPQHA